MERDAIYRFILETGAVHDPYRFAVKVVEGFGELMDFDAALAFFLDANRNIVDQYLYNFNQNWFRIYIDYYSKMDTSSLGYGMQTDAPEREGEAFVHHIDWSNTPENEFIRDYVRENHLSESLTFVLYDLNRQPRAVFTFDLKDGKHFSEEDLDRLKYLVPILNNYYKNFYVKIPGGFRHSNSLYEEASLTRRETEIVDLICQGVSSPNISKILHIAPSTTYKHMTHIFQKFRVSSRQELLVKLLSQET